MALQIAVNRTVPAPVLLCFFNDPTNREKYHIYPKYSITWRKTVSSQAPSLKLFYAQLN